MSANQTLRNRPLGVITTFFTCIALATAVLLFVLTGATPSFAKAKGDACIDCHGDFEQIHENFDHTPTFGTGTVVLFADRTHDSAGWNKPSPQFGVLVNCSTCHISNLTLIHGSNCATCHPSPYDSLDDNWLGGCQQGGCHVNYHEDSISAHAPFESASNPYEVCIQCHIETEGSEYWTVPQTNCLNCHATYTSDTTPPVTTSNAQAIYEGGAIIVFSITDNGKIGIGTTFYKLDDGPVTSGGQVITNSPGEHTLEFWSVDQSGNVESTTNLVNFRIFSDLTPPVTTSNAQDGGTYYQGATITLTATDNSTSGVKTTYYRINSGPTQTGNYVQIPATVGTFNYTLDFWSEDYAANIESQQSVSFTVISGNGTIRLVWGTSDQSGSQVGPGDSASWTVRRGGPSGPIVNLGSGAYPTWSGVNDISLPIRPEPYHVRILWVYANGVETGEENIPNNYITTPGQLIRIQY